MKDGLPTRAPLLGPYPAIKGLETSADWFEESARLDEKAAWYGSGKEHRLMIGARDNALREALRLEEGEAKANPGGGAG